MNQKKSPWLKITIGTERRELVASIAKSEKRSEAAMACNLIDEALKARGYSLDFEDTDVQRRSPPMVKRDRHSMEDYSSISELIEKQLEFFRQETTIPEDKLLLLRSGGKPSPVELVKLAAALGWEAQKLIDLYQQSFPCECEQNL